MASNFFTKLSCGAKMPLLAFGTFPKNLQANLVNAVKTGYRHIDTSFAPENQHHLKLGETLEKDVFNKELVKREDLFITAKLISSPSSIQDDRKMVRNSLKMQLRSLRLQYVDMYLLDFAAPQMKLEKNWEGMEDCVRSGLARSIGLSNCNGQQITRILDTCQLAPSVNQIEIHPARQNVGLAEFCRGSNMHVLAYGPFGLSMNNNTLSLLDNKVLKEIGNQYNKKTAQIILRWLVQQDIGVVVRGVEEKHIASNFNIWDFQLNEADIDKIAELDLHRLVVGTPKQ